MPDLLVHVPNNINQNIAIIEIKPEKRLSSQNIKKGIKKDIRVLKEFIDGGDSIEGYYKGILFLFSTSLGFNNPEEIKENYSVIIKDNIGNNWRDYSSSIKLYWHAEPGSEPVPIDWT